MKKKIINVTPHTIQLQSTQGELYQIPSTCVISAAVVNMFVGTGKQNSELIKTTYGPTTEGLTQLKRIQQQNPDAIIIGSILSAQAYPKEIYAPVPIIGYERVRVADKRMCDGRFRVF